MLQPQAPELEETILGACLIEKEGMALVDELLKPEMFYVTRHQLIYAALQAMFHAGTNIDILTATEELRKRGKLDDAGGPFYITQLSSRVASSAHLEYHARIVHQKYIRREMIVGFSKLLTLSGDETIDLTDTLVDAHNLLDRLEGACGHPATTGYGHSDAGHPGGSGRANAEKQGRSDRHPYRTDRTGQDDGRMAKQ